MNKFKEIIEMKKQKSASRKPRYGTRKLSIGLVSCVLGYAMLVSPSVALADEANEQPIAEETAVPETTANTKEKPEAKEETKPAENSQANDEETEQAAVEEKKVENSEKETTTPAQDGEEKAEEKEEGNETRLTIDQYNAL